MEASRRQGAGVLVALVLVGQLEARPLWTREPPLAEPTPTTSATLDVIGEPLEFPPQPVAIVRARPVFQPAPTETPRPFAPRGSGAGGSPSDAQYELGTWSGLQRGRKGLDGGLQVEAVGSPIRPALQLAPYRLGVGVGWRPAIYGQPLPFVVGLDYVHDFEDQIGRVGVYVSLVRWR